MDISIGRLHNRLRCAHDSKRSILEVTTFLLLMVKIREAMMWRLRIARREAVILAAKCCGPMRQRGGFIHNSVIQN